MAATATPTSDPAAVSVVQLCSRPAGSADPWTFQGTACFVTTTHLVTARHLVDPGHYQVTEEGKLIFDDEDTTREWMILLPTGQSEAQTVSVSVFARPPDQTTDAALLKVEGPDDAINRWVRPVTWLEGITETDWEERGLGRRPFRTLGFPQDEPETSPDGRTVRCSPPVPQRLREIANEEFIPDAGFTWARIAHGGVKKGRSGSPVWINLSAAEYCVGLIEQGGKDFGTASLVGEGAILPWLRRQQIPFASASLEDLPPEELRPYLEQLRKRTRTLLIPILGTSSNADEGRSDPTAWEVRPSEEDFIELFVQLHAQPEGETGPEVRPGEVEALYGVVRDDWRATNPLESFAAASDSEAGLSWEVLQVVTKAVAQEATCAGLEGEAGIQEGTDLSDWRSQLLRGCREFLRAQVRAGRRQLAARSDVWDALCAEQHLVVVGAAGGGKSTVAMFVALALALSPAERGRPKLNALWQRAPDLRGRIPVFIRLRDCRAAVENLGASDLNERVGVVEAILGQGLPPDDSKRIRDLCRAGRALVILDGLDELGGPDACRNFCACLATWRDDDRGANAILVTTRPTAYPPADPNRGGDAWSLNGFGLWRLQPLVPAQQREFLECWMKQHLGGDWPQAADETFKQIQDRQLEDLGAEPLLLATLARLAAWNRRNETRPNPLPATKAGVFEQVIELMLSHWEAGRAGKTHSDLERELVRCGLRTRDLREILGRLALHSLGTPNDRAANVRGDFSLDALHQALVERIKQQPVAVSPAQGAEQLINVLSLRSGLLRPVEAGPFHLAHACFEFPVRSYRNYVAGDGLFRSLPREATPEARAAFQQGHAAFAVFCAEHGLRPTLGPGSTPDPVSSEQALALGMARRVSVEHHEATGFLVLFCQRIKELQSTNQRAFRLILAAVGLALDSRHWRPGLEPGPQRLMVKDEPERALWQAIARHAMHAPEEGWRDRAAAGTLWSLLTKPLGFSQPPRLEWSRKVGEEGALGFLRGDEHAWGGGGSAPCDLVSAPFYLCRYPIRVDDYECYVRATRAPRPADFETRHSLWRTEVFRTPHHPVVGVSWREATACCAWLTGELRAGRLAVPPEVDAQREGWEVRLPTEAEWELGARGPLEAEPPRPAEEGTWHRVPWGWAREDEIRELANCNWDIGWTTVAELFAGPNQEKRNESVSGAVDMVGNVWEWTRTPWVQASGTAGNYPADYAERARLLDAEPATLRVVRGGGWSRAPAYCRCAHRRRNAPVLRNGYLGFRPVLAPVPPGSSGARKG